MQQWTVAIHNNLAHSQLHCELYRQAIVSCDFVLEIQPNNAKALFRKATVSLKKSN